MHTHDDCSAAGENLDLISPLKYDNRQFSKQQATIDVDLRNQSPKVERCAMSWIKTEENSFLQAAIYTRNEVERKD